MNKKILVLTIVSQLFISSNYGFPTYVPTFSLPFTFPTLWINKNTAVTTSKKTEQNPINSPDHEEGKRDFKINDLEYQLKMLPIYSLQWGLCSAMLSIYFFHSFSTTHFNKVLIGGLGVGALYYWSAKKSYTMKLNKLQIESNNYNHHTNNSSLPFN